MRSLLFAVVFSWSLAASAQPPGKPVPDRMGVTLNVRTYPQGTPQEALASVLKALENRRFDVLVTHLLDEKSVESRINEWVRQAEGLAEKDLLAKRTQQQADPNLVPVADRVPVEPTAFAAAVKEAAKIRGHQLAIQDVKIKFDRDPSTVKDLRKFLRDGTFTIQGDTAKVTLKDQIGRGVFFKQVGQRWFLEDRQEELPAAKPMDGK